MITIAKPILNTSSLKVQNTSSNKAKSEFDTETTAELPLAPEIKKEPKGFFSQIKDWFLSFFKSSPNLDGTKDSAATNSEAASCCTNKKDIPKLLSQKENPIKSASSKVGSDFSSSSGSATWSNAGNPSISKSSSSTASCCSGGACSPIRSSGGYSSSYRDYDSGSSYSGSSWSSPNPSKSTKSNLTKSSKEFKEEVPRIKTVGELNQSLKLPEKTIEKITEVNPENTNKKLEDAMQQDTKLAEKVTDDFGAFLTAQETISKEETQTVPPGSQIAQNSEPGSNGNKDESASAPCKDLTKEDLA